MTDQPQPAEALAHALEGKLTECLTWPDGTGIHLFGRNPQPGDPCECGQDTFDELGDDR